VLAVKFFFECWFKSWIFPLVFFSFFCFFCCSFYNCFVNKKNLFVDLNHQTVVVRSAGSTLASTFFLPLTTCLGRLFLIDWNDLVQIVALVRHQALFEMIIDFMIASLNYSSWSVTWGFCVTHEELESLTDIWFHRSVRCDFKNYS